MSDFIREVDEEYRRDRTMALLTRYQVPLAVLVVLVIAGAGAWRFWADRQVTAAEAVSARYLAAADLAKDGKTEQAQAAFAALAKDGPAGAAMLARMRAAEILAVQDPERAAKAFDAVASEETLPASMRDAARLRGAMLRIDLEEPKAFESRYGRFAQPGAGGFRNGFRELMALAALKQGDYEAAGRYLDQIIIDPDAPVGLRGRAQAFRQLVTAGPATAMAKRPPPARITPVGQGGKPEAPASTNGATPAPGPVGPH